MYLNDESQKGREIAVFWIIFNICGFFFFFFFGPLAAWTLSFQSRNGNELNVHRVHGGHGLWLVLGRHYKPTILREHESTGNRSRKAFFEENLQNMGKDHPKLEGGMHAASVFLRQCLLLIPAKPREHETYTIEQGHRIGLRAGLLRSLVVS
jgi:hypothetical protein